ncbi:MAG: thiamine-phosphate kinase [Gammaproteobacteria bacterium]|nr:thiamine-phosphate kinase [Gammaproteobacteria bacterium]
MSRPAPLTEAAIIERFFVRPARRRDVLLGIGDDAAVTRLAAGHDLVTAADAIFEGVHFPAGTPARAIGHRCLAVNLSDLAAMGAEPLWATLALSLPAPDSAWLREFARGFFALADAWRVALIGGDTVRGPLGMSVTVHGRVRRGRYVPRSTARPGDGLYVTGHPGDAVAGRLLLERSRGGRAAAQLRQRFLYPQPRLTEGRLLVPLASAMMDVSDGLHDDAGKLLRASGLGADLDAAAIPLSPALRAVAGMPRGRLLALTGGDDYELLFTVPARREPLLARAAQRWPCGIARLGTVSARPGLRWRLDGRRYRFADSTFRHFAPGRR